MPYNAPAAAKRDGILFANRRAMATMQDKVLNLGYSVGQPSYGYGALLARRFDFPGVRCYGIADYRAPAVRFRRFEADGRLADARCCRYASRWARHEIVSIGAIPPNAQEAVAVSSRAKIAVIILMPVIALLPVRYVSVQFKNNHRE